MRKSDCISELPTREKSPDIFFTQQEKFILRTVIVCFFSQWKCCEIVTDEIPDNHRDSTTSGCAPLSPTYVKLLWDSSL